MRLESRARRTNRDEREFLPYGPTSRIYQREYKVLVLGSVMGRKATTLSLGMFISAGFRRD